MRLPESAASTGRSSDGSPASAMIRRWSVAWCPVVFGAMSDSTTSARPRIASMVRCSASGSWKSPCSTVAPGTGSIGRMSIATTWPFGPTTCTATCATRIPGRGS